MCGSARKQHYPGPEGKALCKQQGFSYDVARAITLVPQIKKQFKASANKCWDCLARLAKTSK